MIVYEDLGRLNAVFGRELAASFDDTLGSGRFVLGARVELFEEEFARYLGAKFCIGVGSGMDALFLALKAFGFADGDEVIVPSNAYIATILAIIHNRLRPVLVEPDMATYNIDPRKIEEHITPRTRAIVAVHLYGKPCDMDLVTAMAHAHGLMLIEDCAQAHGAEYRGRKAGTFGHFGAYSFYPTKNLGALGDGGALVTDDPNLAQTIRKLRNYGSDVRFHNALAGFNSRLDEVQAGFLSVKLKHLDEIVGHKRACAALYHSSLDKKYSLPLIQEECRDAYHIFAIRHPLRDRLRKHLSDQGIQTEIHYPVPPHRQEALRHVLDGARYPVSEEIHATVLSLPISYIHSEEDILAVIRAVNSFEERL